MSKSEKKQEEKSLSENQDKKSENEDKDLIWRKLVNEKFPLGISVGVAIYNPNVNESLEELAARADAAMYQVKNANKQGFLLATL